MNLETLRANIPREMQSVVQWILWRNVDGRKIPFQIDGRHAKSNDPDTWTDFESAAASAGAIPKGMGGLGFCFSQDDGFFGVDLDGCIGPSGAVEPWAVEVVQKLASYSEVSPSGTGVKVFGQGRLADGKGRKVAVEAGQVADGKAPAIEVYDRGRYFAVTGDVLPWSAPFSDAQAGLDAVLSRFFAPKVPATPAAVPAIPSSRPDLTERATAYMRSVDPAIAGQSGHNTTFRAACALVIGFGLTPEEAFPIFAEWNDRCLPPWSDADLARKLDQADKQPGERGTLIGDAGAIEAVRAMLREFAANSHAKWMERHGIPATAPIAAEPCEPEVVAPKSPKFPEECLRPPGWLTDVIEWNLKTAMYPMPKLALAGSLAALATVVGRKLTDCFETRANIYSLGLAPSGSGKEHSRTVNKRILRAAGAKDRLGPERIGSHSGLINWVKKEPAILFQLDEIGRLFATMKSASKSPHLFNIASVLMSLYSASGEVWRGDAYAEVERTPEIDQPHAVVYGTTTPADFWDSLTASNVSDGFLGRFFAFEDEDGSLNEDQQPGKIVPDKITIGARYWMELPTGRGNFANVAPEPMTLPHSPDALERFKAHMREIRARRKEDEDTTGALWARSGGKAGKLALLFAASRCTNGAGASIEVCDVDLAIKLSNYLTRRMIYQVFEQVSENEIVAKKKRVLRIIGEDSLTANQLTRKTQFLGKRERDEILIDLVSAGYLESVTGKSCSPSGGRPVTLFRRLGINQNH